MRQPREGEAAFVAMSGSPISEQFGGRPQDEVMRTRSTAIGAAPAREHALTASEVLFRTAFENAPIGMALVAPDGRMLQVNYALCAMLGYTEDELLAMSIGEITDARDRSDTFAHVARALAGEMDAYGVEKRYIHRAGHVVWAQLSTSLVRDDDGAPRYFISQIQDITARKAAEAELAAAHQHTRDVLERITDGFCAVDLDWRLTYFNAAAEQLFGRAREELLGRDCWDAFAPAVGTPVDGALHQAMSEGTTTSLELYSPSTDRWLEVRAYPAPDGLSIFFHDVTERRQLAEELQLSEAKYRTLVEHLPAVVYLLANDERQTAIYFSPYLQVLTGYSPEEVLARAADWQWLDMIHPDDRDWVTAYDLAYDGSSEPFRIEYRLVRADGSSVWVRDECVPVRDETGQIVAWQGVLLDISERVQAEEARSRLAAIVESAEDAVISSALDGTITSWNRAAEKLYGYRAEEIIGQPFIVLVPDDQLAVTRGTLDRLFATAESDPRVIQLETTRLRRDGTRVNVALTFSPVRDRHGVMVGVSTIARDISERKRAEEALRTALEAAHAANRTKNLFLATMSHELRTPLQAVLGYSEFLLGDATGSLSTDQAEDIGYIHQGARRMVTLIEQMLDLSRLEAGRLEMASEPVDLGEIIEQVRQDVAPQAMQKRLALDIELPPSLPRVLGDAERLRQVLLNLVGNAVKFTEQGSVWVRAGTTENGVDVIVRDSGIGIMPEALPHIFEEFRQAEIGMTRRRGGAGLGLAIARKLAEQMGGGISVQSQPGAGSTFTLHLLAAATPAMEHSATPISAE
jgi:PAS domain S-box-containing protein